VIIKLAQLKLSLAKNKIKDGVKSIQTGTALHQLVRAIFA
jgi:hypothetical protein